MDEDARASTAGDGAGTAASDAAAEAIAAQLNNLDKRHVGAAMSKMISASIGDICVVLSKSSTYKFHTLADIEWLVLPAVASGQFYVAALASKQDGFTAPAAVVTWASVSDQVDARLRSDTERQPRLRPDEWSGGAHVWLIDMVGDTKVVAQALVEMGRTRFKDTTINLRTLNNGHTPEITTLSSLVGSLGDNGVSAL